MLPEVPAEGRPFALAGGAARATTLGTTFDYHSGNPLDNDGGGSSGIGWLKSGVTWCMYLKLPNLETTVKGPVNSPAPEDLLKPVKGLLIVQHTATAVLICTI